MPSSRTLIGLAAGAAAALAAYMVYKKKQNRLKVRVLPDKYKLGAAAAKHVAALVTATIEAKGHARVIFATGASQYAAAPKPCIPLASCKAVLRLQCHLSPDPRSMLTHACMCAPLPTGLSSSMSCSS